MNICKSSPPQDMGAIGDDRTSRDVMVRRIRPDMSAPPERGASSSRQASAVDNRRYYRGRAIAMMTTRLPRRRPVVDTSSDLDIRVTGIMTPMPLGEGSSDETSGIREL